VAYGNGGMNASQQVLPAATRSVILAVEDLHRTSEHAAIDDAALARAVIRLSDLYTSERRSLSREQADEDHLIAKCGYFLASDAPKVALALQEAAARSATFAQLSRLDCVRVLDLGAGVGATSCGFLAWLAAAHAQAHANATHDRRMRVELHAFELGAPAAHAYEQSVRVAAAAANVDVEIHVEARDFRHKSVPALAQASDVILCQTALNELLVEDHVDPRHLPATVDMVAQWARAAPLLLIEPALRSTTRALMALRDALIARNAAQPAATVVAPCLHQHACPMRAKVDDWCHEARRVEPTPRVAALNRIVGRRDGRALFAYLATVPFREGAPKSLIPESAIRIVTDTLGSRGKTERVVCRADGELRLMRLLDRETRPENALFVEGERGMAVTVNPMPANDRIGPEVMVAPLAPIGE
jgi:ribosomal protein RSM22 (predicted rRNA methylase)